VSLYSRVATVINNTALFFKQNETWALDVGESGIVKPRLVSGSIGCTAPYTIDSADVEVSPAVWRRIAIWQSQEGIMYSDGTSPICISGDLGNLFDSSDGSYLTAATLSTCRGFIDPQRSEYVWVVPGVTEYVFSLIDKKWFEIDRTATTRLRGGLSVYDSYGASYIYGFGTNYVWRLENGYTFDGEDIACSVKFGDMAVDEGSIFKKTTLKSTKLVAVALASATNTIALTHNGDGATASTTLKAISPLNSGKRLIGKIVPNSTGSHIFHTFKLAFNVNATNAGFEPIFFGINYSNDGKDL